MSQKKHATELLEIAFLINILNIKKQISKFDEAEILQNSNIELSHINFFEEFELLEENRI